MLGWEALQLANFPFSMLHESVIAPQKTLAISGESVPELPVFLVQANFITGGLLLTFNGQHGSMDMTGQGQLMYLLAKACRNEPFTPSELTIGMMDRKNIIPLLDNAIPDPKIDYQKSKDDTPNAANPPAQLQHPPPKCIWAYFIFPATSLAALKSLAIKTIPPSSFISTDDVLTAFTWQSIARARLPRLPSPTTAQSSLSRNVDVRRHLSLPPTYPGLVAHSTSHTSTTQDLVQQPLGDIAARLRSALNPALLRQEKLAIATRLSRGETVPAVSAVAVGGPSLDVRLSSWAKERCYDLDFGLGFGIGKPKALRRPAFTEGAREGLVYFLPKTLDSEIAVGLCLREVDLERLKGDEEFTKFGSYVG